MHSKIFINVQGQMGASVSLTGIKPRTCDRYTVSFLSYEWNLKSIQTPIIQSFVVLSLFAHTQVLRKIFRNLPQ